MSVVLRGRRLAQTALAAGAESAAGGRARVALVEGLPGSGKSALCAHTAHQVRNAGFHVLGVVGVEGESDLPLAGLSAMLRPLVSGFAGWDLPEVQFRALRSAAGLSDEPIVDRFTLGAAVLGALAAAAESDPLLLIIDDAQWLDSASADAVSFALRRLAADRVLAVIASRLDQLRLVLPADVDRIELEGLGESETAAMLDDAGLTSSVPVVRAVAAATGGLPLAVLETARALSPEQRSGQAALPDPLPIGRDVTRGYAARIAALPQRTQRAVALLATAGSAPTHVVITALASCGLGLDDLEPAETAEILRIEPAAIPFAHPLLRAAALHLAAPAQQRAHHRALAEAADTVELRARHLVGAATGPDEALAAMLEQAAAEVARRGGAVAAAPLLAQAAEFSLPGGRRLDRQVDAARALVMSGQVQRALGLAREVMSATHDPIWRMDAASIIVDCSSWAADATTALALAREEAHRISARDPERAIGALLQAGTIAMAHGLLVEMLQIAEQAVALITPSTGREVQAAAHQIHAFALLMRGYHPRAQVVMDQWAPTELATITAADANFVRYPDTAYALLRLGRYQQATELTAALLRACDRETTPTAKAYVLAAASQTRRWTGQWAQALAMGEQAAALAEQTGQLMLHGFVRAETAAILAGQGEITLSQAYIQTALDTARAYDVSTMRVFALAAQGLLNLSRSDPAAAVTALAEADDTRRALACLDPSCVPFGPDLIEALTRAGETSRARRALEEHTEMAHLSQLPWAQAAMARCRGMLTDDADEADTSFDTALRTHPPELSFEIARTELAWGEHLRRRRNHTDSRAHLHRAFGIFERLGARPWAHRAGGELRAAGLKPSTTRAPDLAALTAQELNCALAIKSGLSNREAAASLFISAKTVEYHLSKAYTKLGVSSRTQLARLLASTEPA